MSRRSLLSQRTEESATEKEKEQIALIEAALYVTGRPVDVKTLGSIIRARSEERIRSLARILAEQYRQMRSAMEILELQDGRYVMQLKPNYVRSVKRLATRQLLTPGPLKTLSFIAFKQPVTQAYVVRVRGNLAYGHVKVLREMGLIQEEKLGRTKILRTTETFADYFNLSHDIRLMKRQLEKLFGELGQVKPEERAPTGRVQSENLKD